MKDLAVAIGLVLVIEGLIWAAIPGVARRLLEAVQGVPEQALRLAGTSALALGVLIVWVARG